MFELTTIIWVTIIFAVVFMMLPVLFALLIVFSSCYLYFYRLIYGRRYDNFQELWQRPLHRISQFLYYHSKIYHGYEIHGLENIPDGPAILIFYHAGMLIDIFYASANIYLKKNRKVVPIVEKKTFGQKGGQTFFQATEATPGTIESCIEILQKDKLLAIAPGGLRECLFSDSTYNLIWGTRSGFAKVAIEAKVPLVPLFTQNSRALNYVPNLFPGYFRKSYEKTKFGFVPTFGWFPVKLRTYIGKPIEYDPNRSVDQLVQLTKESLEDLIKQHQRIPGTICSGLLDRIYNRSNKNN